MTCWKCVIFHALRLLVDFKNNSGQEKNNAGQDLLRLKTRPFLRRPFLRRP